MTVAEEPVAEPARASALRRGLHGLSSVLIISGLLLLLDAGLTVVWQEPVSALYASREQGHLRREFTQLTQLQPSPVEKRALAGLPDVRARMAFAARALDRKARPGQPIGRIRIRRIALSKIVVEGTGTEDLHKGPGHYPSTPLPGAPGTVAVAGHRTTYGAPFRKLDKVRKGDDVEVQMPYGTVTYRVERTRIVPANALWVTQRVSYDRLVLTACHPLYSAAQRIVIFARQVAEKPAPGIV